MIEDLSWEQFAARPGVELLRANIGDGGPLQLGVRLRRGKVFVTGAMAFPVAEGATSTASFCDLMPDKAATLLAPLPPASGALSDALILPCIENYYHFMIYRFPALMFLRAFPDGATVTLAQIAGAPPSVTATVRDVGMNLCERRRVDVVHLGDGVHDVSNAVFTKTRNPWFAARFHRAFTLPILMEKARAAGFDAETPLKLFVRRTSASRKLVNQSEIESWYAPRGYLPVDPGTLPLHEQAALFARATHIAGVEGAAMTNLVFAVHAQSVTMLSSPMLANDRFFEDLIESYGVKFTKVCGRVPAPGPFTRNSDFDVPIGWVAAAET